MGTIVSYISPANTGRTDDPDPATGLTSRDKYLVRTSWARIMKNSTDSGVALLTLFLKNHPEYLDLFPFKNVPLDQLSTNKRFRAHCSSVIYALASIVDALNDNELLIQLLLKTGSSHISRNVKAKGFKDLQDATVELFSAVMKPDELEAWKKTLEVAFGVILKGLVEGEKL
ncbi:globin isoform X2 [Sitophilus oryzae]|uniref:Globin isoform X2 n=1 Tax=Sitophilus oryzae TaxID=7048 RepID=A0A6J2XUT7_SITOR|nr:globin isoform X2 [Sitophilus oryzae]